MRRIERFHVVDLICWHEPSEQLVDHANPGARLAYWNLLATRRHPPVMAESLEAREPEATRLGDEARAFFYQALVLEVAR